MKKLFTFLAFVFITINSFAQKLSYGITGGVDIGTLQASATGTTTTNTTDSHISSLFKAYADFRFGNFSIQPALEFAGKGGNVATGDGGTGQFALHYLQIPLNVLYHIPVTGYDIYFGGGPYLGFATGGTVSVAGPAGDDSESLIFGGEGYFNTSDSGIGMLGGMQLKTGFLFQFGYDLGLANIVNKYGPLGGYAAIKTRTFEISAGFAF